MVQEFPTVCRQLSLRLWTLIEKVSLKCKKERHVREAFHTMSYMETGLKFHDFLSCDNVDHFILEVISINFLVFFFFWVSSKVFADLSMYEAWAALGAAQGVQMKPLSWAKKKICILFFLI